MQLHDLMANLFELRQVAADQAKDGPSGSGAMARALTAYEWLGDNIEAFVAGLDPEMTEGPASQTEGMGGDAGTIAAICRGYELMHRALCNLAGTSGAALPWYTAKATETSKRITALSDVRAGDNAAMPGDCFSQTVKVLASLTPPETAEAVPVAQTVELDVCDAGRSHVRDKAGYVAELRFTNGGYGCELKSHIMYGLPEGVHKVYAACTVEVLQNDADKLRAHVEAIENKLSEAEERFTTLVTLTSEITEAAVALVYEWTDRSGATQRGLCFNTSAERVTKVHGQPPRYVGNLYPHPDPEAARLREELERVTRDLSTANDKLETMYSEHAAEKLRADDAVKALETAREALKPFSDYADPLRTAYPDDMPMTKGSAIAARQVTAGDFRRARAAYHAAARSASSQGGE